MRTISRQTYRAGSITVLLVLVAAAALLSFAALNGTTPVNAQPSTASASATCMTSFADVPPSNPFYSYVQCLHCQGIVTGFGDGTYRTGAPISRGQISKVVSNAAGFHEDPGGQIYADVAPGDPFYDYINRLTHRGIISGYPCPTGPGGSMSAEACTPENPSIFLPNANATRGQMAKIVSNAAAFSEDVSGQTFHDVLPGSTFYTWIERLASRHVIGGYACGGQDEPCDEQDRPYYRPGALVTRGQAAKIVALAFAGLCEGATPPTSTPTPPAADTPTPTSAATSTATPIAASTQTVTPTLAETGSPGATQTETPLPSNTTAPTNTYTATSTATNTATNTPSDTPTNTATFAPTDTATDTPTDTATYTPTDTATYTTTPTPTSTATDTPTQTPTDTATNTATDTATYTATDTATATATATDTATNTSTSTPTNTPTDTATNTPTYTPTSTSTNTPTSTATNTATNTATSTSTSTPTNTPTVTPTNTPLNSCTFSGSITITDTASNGEPRFSFYTSSCGFTPPYPGTTDSATLIHYDKYTVHNSSASTACVTVQVVPCSGGPGSFLSYAYSPSFNPLDPSQNSLGGSGYNRSSTFQYSFNLAAGANADIVIWEDNVSGCNTYSMTVSGLNGADNCPVGLTSPISQRSTGKAQPPGATTRYAAPGSADCDTSFPDVPPSDPFYTYVQCLHCKGIVSGFSDGTFRTYAEITRGQISKIVSNAAGFNEDPGPQVYADVKPGDPFYDYINRLTHRGIVGGYSTPGGLPMFVPNGDATRGQMAKIVSNAAVFDEDVSGQTFEDVPPGSTFYVWIMRLSNRGVISGYPCGGPGEPCDNLSRPYYRPGSLVSRGQASKIVAGAFSGLCQAVPTSTSTPTTPGATSTATSTTTPSATSTGTVTHVPTNTSTSTGTNTPTVPTGTPTNTPTHTSTPTATSSPTDTATVTPTYTPSDTATITPTSTSTNTPTDTATSTSTSTPTSTASPCTVNGSIDESSDSYEVGRASNTTNASQCQVPQNPVYPGTTGGPPNNYHYYYDAYTYHNSSASDTCVTVTINPMTCAQFPTYIHSVAYLNSFDPANLSQNYLANIGQAPTSPNTLVSYSFTVPAASNFVVVVAEANPGHPCAAYSVTASGLPNNCPVTSSLATHRK